MIEIIIHEINLFFVYSVFGFVWETLWISFHKKKWVNRGFLHGPYLPIYGFGALLIIGVTRPIVANPPLVFFVGLLAATLLELVTGIAIEKIFCVRYWDYDERFLNYKGYICLRSSLFFGCMAVLLTQWINLPVENFLWTHQTRDTVFFTALFFFAFVSDVVRSVQEAFDLRVLLQAERWIDYTQTIRRAIKDKAYAGRDKVLRALEMLRPDEVIEEWKQKKEVGYRKLEFMLSDIVSTKQEQEQRIKNKWLEMFEDNSGLYRDLSEKYRQAISNAYVQRKLKIERWERSAESILKRNDATFRKSQKKRKKA